MPLRLQALYWASIVSNVVFFLSVYFTFGFFLLAFLLSALSISSLINFALSRSLLKGKSIQGFHICERLKNFAFVYGDNIFLTEDILNDRDVLEATLIHEYAHILTLRGRKIRYLSGFNPLALFNSAASTGGCTKGFKGLVSSFNLLLILIVEIGILILADNTGLAFAFLLFFLIGLFGALSTRYFNSFYVIGSVIVAALSPGFFSIAYAVSLVLYIAYRLNEEILADLYGVACAGETYLKGLSKLLNVEKVKKRNIVVDVILFLNTHLNGHLRIYYIEKKLKEGKLKCRCGL